MFNFKKNKSNLFRRKQESVEALFYDGLNAQEAFDFIGGDLDRGLYGGRPYLRRSEGDIVLRTNIYLYKGEGYVGSYGQEAFEQHYEKVSEK